MPSAASVAWSALWSALRHDPGLVALNPTWRGPGEFDSLDFAEEPAEPHVLTIRVRPRETRREAMASLGDGARLWEIDLTLDVALNAPTGVWGDAADAWDAIAAALESARGTLESAGVADLDITTPAEWGTPGAIVCTVLLER